MSPLQASFGKPFDFQVAAWRLRLGRLLPTSAWTDLWKEAHDRAFVVAGAMRADILADLAQAVDKAVTEGATLEDFRRDFRSIVAAKGWQISPAGHGSKRGEAWRTRVIYRTNMATSYAAGRWAQLKAAGYPFLVYRHGASLEPRVQHLAWDGLVLEADHAFWNTHAPPNGWGCSCYVNGARSREAARRLGGDPDKKLPDGWAKPDPRTGAPAGIDRGWDYAPGASVTSVVEAAARKIATLPPLIGSDYGSSLEAIVSKAWPVWLSEAEAGRQSRPGLAGVLFREVIEALGSVDRAPRTADVLVSPGLVTGAKARRHLQAGDALTAEDWQSLPSLLRRPQAVALDLRSGKLLYVLAGEDRAPQLAVEIDQLLGKSGDDRAIANLVVSAYRPRLADLRARIKGGLIRVLIGDIR